MNVLVAGTVLAVALVVVPGLTMLLVPYFRATGEQIVDFIIAFELACLPAHLILVAIFMRRHGSAVRWLAGDPSVDAREVWRSGVVDLPRTVVLIVFGYVVCVLPAVYYVSREVDLSALGATLYLTMLVFLLAGVGVIAYLFFELALRPVLRRVAAEFGDGRKPPEGGASLGGRLLVLLPLINLFIAMVVAAVSTNSLELEGRLAVTVACAVAVTVTVSLTMSFLLRQSLLSRLTDLRYALGRVERGDLDARLVPVAGDEFDEVGHTFNGMVARLRGHDEEMRESRARIVTASDEARRKVERDLHDGAQQHLVLLRLKLGLLEKAAARDPATVPALVENAREDLTRALTELRDLAHGIYPAVLQNDGLPGALAEAAGHAGLPTELECELSRRYPPEIEAAVYFCCLEALQNAGKYAGEDAKASVRLAERDGELWFEIADDGRGYDPAATPASAGLQNMSDRIGAFGGRLRIDSAPGAGTTVSGTVPVDADGSSGGSRVGRPPS